jgi:hypothetical protein
MRRAVAPRISDTSDAWEPSRHSHETSSASPTLPLSHGAMRASVEERAVKSPLDCHSAVRQRSIARAQCPVRVGGERVKQTPRIVSAVPECVSSRSRREERPATWRLRSAAGAPFRRGRPTPFLRAACAHPASAGSGGVPAAAGFAVLHRQIRAMMLAPLQMSRPASATSHVTTSAARPSLPPGRRSRESRARARLSGSVMPSFAAAPVRSQAASNPARVFPYSLPAHKSQTHAAPRKKRDWLGAGSP